jgi:hypothetical protein
VVFTNGQDVAFLLVAVLGAWHCLRAGRQTAAGVLFGLCTAKFHLFLLLPLFLIRYRLWKTVAAAAGVVAVLIGLSFAAGGADWIPRYAHALSDPRLNPYAANMVNLRGLFGYGSPWTWPVALVVAALCAFLIWKGSLEIALATVLAGGVLITPHNTLSDGVLFLPALLMARHMPARLGRVAAVICLTPLYVFVSRGLMQGGMLAILICTVLLVWRQSQRQPALPQTASAALR